MPELSRSLTVRLDRAARRELDRRAREAGVPASQLVRNLIRQHLAALREAEGR
jgi:hypothetical protein